MNENNTNPNTGEKNSSDGGKYFTQDQVNQIISKRLAEEKAKADSSVTAREQELTRREMALRAKELLSEKGLPLTLADVLRYTDEESLLSAVNSLSNLKGFKGEEKHPERKIIENKLPTGDAGRRGIDPIRAAFNLNKQE